MKAAAEAREADGLHHAKDVCRARHAVPLQKPTTAHSRARLISQARLISRAPLTVASGALSDVDLGALYAAPLQIRTARQCCPPEGVRYERKKTSQSGGLFRLLVRYSQDFPDAVSGGDFARAAAFSGEPFVEVAERHRVLDGDVGDRDAGDVESIRDSGNPFLAGERFEAERDGFVEGGSGDLDGVVHALHVPDGDAARADGHGRECNSFAFCSPCAVQKEEVRGVRERQRQQKEISLTPSANGAVGSGMTT